jgi:hypothetical protein
MGSELSAEFIETLDTIIIFVVNIKSKNSYSRAGNYLIEN